MQGVGGLVQNIGQSRGNYFHLAATFLGKQVQKLVLNDALAVNTWQIEGLKFSKSEAFTVCFKLCFKQSQK